MDNSKSAEEDNFPHRGWFALPPYGASSDFVPRYKASCFCKRVQFEVDTDPLISKLSDCSDNQRLHGAPCQWAAIFKKMNVRFSPSSDQFLRFYNTSTDTAFDSGNGRVLPCKIQCKHCGTWVADEGRNMFMAFPTLFDFVDGRAEPTIPKAFEPSVHIHCATKALPHSLISSNPHFLDDCQTPRSVGDFLMHIAPPLDGSGHKGGAGRIGVLGGSIDYAGAPFYAGMASLRVGAELLYLLTAQEATGPIKSYSPELMVTGVYRTDLIEDASTSQNEIKQMVARVDEKLRRMHALIIGPGLGRSPNVLEAVAQIIQRAKEMDLPLVIDADCLWLINQRPFLVQGYTNAVLTPNKMEYKRLCEAVSKENLKDPLSLPDLCDLLGGPLVVKKGKVDEIGCAGGVEPLRCDAEGAPRRPGGLGDFLAGTLGTMLAWGEMKRKVDKRQVCVVACTLVRLACLKAFRKFHRAMVAPDVLAEVGAAFEDLTELDANGNTNSPRL